MIAVFASFILNGDPTVKQFGVGLSVGVALAALTVLLFAPALLVLVGRRGAYWVPKWSERVVPHIDIEGATMDRSGGTTSAKKPAPARSSKDSMRL
jgi:RND superfamily putative drug exporter